MPRRRTVAEWLTSATLGTVAMPGSIRRTQHETMRLGRTIMKIATLFSFLTGCAKEPTGPGVSMELSYPVLLANDRSLVVKDDPESLTTTSVATGLNFPEFTLLDSNGTLYTIQKVTAFGRKSVVFDMGTSRFRVFLELGAKRQPTLQEAKSLVKEMAFSRGAVQDRQAVSRVIDAATSFPELIEAARESWSWR